MSFMFLLLSLIVHFHVDMFLTTLVHSPYLMFSHDLVFMSTNCAIWILSVLVPCGLHVSS